MQKFRYVYIKKRYRWILIPLVLLILGLAYSGRYLDFGFNDDEKDAIGRIQATGQLVALTERNSLDYFIFNGEPMGFQYELLKSFADHLGTHLKIISSSDVYQLHYYLDLNLGDLIAADLPVSRDGKKMIHYSQPLLESRMILIQRKQSKGNENSKFIEKPDQLDEDTVYLRRDPFLVPLIEEVLEDAGADVTIIEDGANNTETLINMVSNGKIKYTVCDENLVEVIKNSYANLDASVVLTEPVPVSWGVRLSSDSLLVKVNEWMTEIKKDGRLKKIYAKYYQNQRIASYFRRDYFSVTDEKLSPYDQQIRSYSKMIFWDWRLVASLIYEESNFRTGLVSSRNASGLMQLMPETASLLGVDSTSTPSQQIMAGIKYLKWIDDQLPVEITDKRERINFILASYNVGIGKVLEARKMANKYGKNPNKWDGNVDYYLTSKSRHTPLPGDDHIDPSPHGLAGGFVANIIERYQHYRNNIPE